MPGRLGSALGIRVERRWVDDDPDLAERSGSEVPVLLLDEREVVAIGWTPGC